LRIAFSGTHRSGKSTLLERVSELLPGYASIEEPYHLLEEEGYETREEPSLDDFEAQLERSLACVEDAADDVLFDRCPADLLAYLLTHADADSFDLDQWTERVVDALSALDLIVFVPVEQPDRIALPSYENAEQRRRVHEKLEEILLDGRIDLEVEVVRVEGDVDARVAQVMQRIAG
jgi:hypothetical protein